MLRLNEGLKGTVASLFTSAQLRHLAALKDADSPGMRARRNLDEASVEELAEMLVAGKTPTIGWWRRHSQVAPQMAPEMAETAVST
jgi:hypothetical protein